MQTSASSSTTTETIVASTPSVTAPPAPERELKTEIKSEEKSELKTEGKYAPVTLAQLHRMASSLEAPRSGTSTGSRYVSYRPQTLAEALLPVQDDKKVAVETVPELVSSVPAAVEDITPPQTTKASYLPYRRESLAAYLPYQIGSSLNERTPEEQAAALAAQFQRILLGTTLLPLGSVTIGEKLGNGAFGQVFRGTWGDKPVALKEIAIEHAQQQLGFLDGEQILESFEWEIARLSAVNHPNLVTYYGLYQQNDRYFITMELCASGTLRDALGGTKEKSKPKYELTHAQRWQIALELAQGLAYLHEQGILHRDLKAANVLLDAEGHAKLADLGVAQVDALMQRETVEVVEEGLSDKRFNAPEELKAGSSSVRSSLASDIFAYGLILWELFTDKEPENLSYEEVTKRLAEHKHEREPIPTDEKECPPAFAELMRACWHPDPRQRPKAVQVVSQLQALAAQLHPQPAVALAQQRSQQLLHEQRATLTYYIPSFSLPYELTEDADSYWHKREQEEEKAIAKAKKAKEKKDSKESKTTDPLQPIHRALQHFMADAKARVLVIFGDAGLGKSSAAYQLALDYVQQSQPRYLPLLLRPGLAEWRHGALSDGLNHAMVSAAYGLTPAQQTVLKTQPVLWIIDGYDELQNDIAPQNLPQQLGLDQWSNAKLIISCRPGTVPKHEQSARFGHGGSRHWQPLYLLPFKQLQCLDYMQRRLGWSTKERNAFAKILATTPTLRALVRNPFVLELLVNGWAEFKNQPLGQLTRFTVYERSIGYYLEQQAKLLPVEVRRCLQGDHPDLNSSFMQMAEILADYGHARDQALVPLNQALTQLDDRHSLWLQLPKLVSHYARHEYRERRRQMDEEQRHRAILSESDYRRLRRQQAEQFLKGSPFKSHQERQAHDYRHRSLYEYCIAHGIVSALHTSAVPRLWQYLHYRLIQTEALVVAFLREAYRRQSALVQRAWENQLQSLISSSAHSTLPSGMEGAPWHWSANAVSLLVDWRVSLMHQAWSGIQAPGAMLSYTNFAYSDLSYANLRGATLIHTLLYEVNFTGADLWDVRWGERPRLELAERVTTIAHHPREPWVAVGQFDGLIVLMHTDTGARLGTFAGHTSYVMSVAFSGDGGTLASGSDDRMVRLWDVATRKPIGEPLAGHEDVVTSVSFSGNGVTLASGSEDKTVRLWDVRTRQGLGKPLAGHKDAVLSVSFSGDGEMLASGSRDKTLRLWDVRTQQAIGEPLGHTGWVRSVSFSADGVTLASGSEDQRVRLWDLRTRQPIGEPLAGHEDAVTSVVFSADGVTLASGSYDKTVRLWNVRTRQPIGEPLAGHTNQVRGVSFSGDGVMLASGSLDKTVHLWDVASRQAIGEPLAGHAKWVSSVSFSGDGGMLASGSEDNTVRLWDVRTGQGIGEPLVGHTGVVLSIAFSGDGGTLASGSWDRTVRLWDVRTGQGIGEPLTGHMGSVNSIAFSGDGVTLASVSRDQTVRLWDVRTRQAIGEPLVGHRKEVTSVSFSGDGMTLASGSRDQTVRLWDVRTRRAIGEPLAEHTGWITSVSLSGDGVTLASGSKDMTVRLWDVRKQTVIGRPLGHEDGVTGVIFSPSGAQLASLSGGKVYLWEAKSQHQVGKVRWHVDIRSIASGRVPVEYKPTAGEWCLALGDVAGAISFWAVKEDGSVRLLGTPAHSSMPLLPWGVRWTGCQLNTPSRRLLTQYGAEFDAKAEEKAKAVVEATAERTAEEKSGAESKAKETMTVVARGTVVEDLPPRVEAKPETAAVIVASAESLSVEPKMRTLSMSMRQRIAMFEQPMAMENKESAERKSYAGIVAEMTPGTPTSAAASPTVTPGAHLSISLTTVGLFASSPSARTAATPPALSPEAQRQADLKWLDQLEQQADDSLDFHDPEQLRLSLRYTDAIDAAREHCATVPLTEAQRTALTAIERECTERLAQKTAAVALRPSA